MNKARIIYGLLSLFSLILGVCIYLLFRDMSNMALFVWLPKAQLTNTVFIPLESSFLSSIVKYYLPDMLWFVSGILLVRFIWFLNSQVQRRYISCFYGIGVAFEISQLSEKIPGTFDFLDLLFMGIGAFVEGLLYNIFVKRRFA